MTAEKKEEFWRWTELQWRNPEKDWTKSSIITAGVDVGSVSSKATVMVDGEIYAYSYLRTGSDSPDSANRAFKSAVSDSGLTLDKIHYFVGTGYGRVNVPFAHKTVTEIACHGRGANFIYGPTTRTVLDMGGQDCKAIHVDERGKVTQFLMNDKCAAGTGRGMEVIADLLAVPITQVGKMSLDITKDPPPVSSTCTVFAKSEAIGLLRKGWNKNEVLAAYCEGMAHRVVNLLQRIGVQKDFVITGGISQNPGITKRIEKELGVTALESKRWSPQLAGCIGAALFARDLLEKSRRMAAATATT